MSVEAVCIATMADRVKGALFGILIADALAMPTHWFYGGDRQVRSTYGKINGYVQPSVHLPGSIMSKSNTGGAGRGGYNGDVIGNIIFHGKKPFWKPGADFHYHTGMPAGDNTLEALLTRRVINITAENQGVYAADKILSDYIQFMTTPGTHNDTYCGTCHRMFFAKHAAGFPPAECPDNDQHNVDTADAIVTTIPVSLTSSDDDEATQQVKEQVALTRASPQSQEFAAHFSSMLRSIVRGTSLRSAVTTTANTIGFDVQRAGGSDPVTA